TQSRLSSMADKLLFILFYFKIYPLQEVIALLFGMSQGRANEWIRKLSTVLKLALMTPCAYPNGICKIWSKFLPSCGFMPYFGDSLKGSRVCSAYQPCRRGHGRPSRDSRLCGPAVGLGSVTLARRLTLHVG